MNKADLHIHTLDSPCSNMTPLEVSKRVEKKEISAIAITNHDVVSSKHINIIKENTKSSIRVLKGIEITTTEGHILGIGVSGTFSYEPPISPTKAVDLIHENNGYAILAHPYDTLRESFSSDTIIELSSMVDAIEVRNGRCLFPIFNRRAKIAAQKLDISMTGGSDAHFVNEVGNSYTLFPEDVKIEKSIENGYSEIGGKNWSLIGHVQTKSREIF